MTQSAVRLKFAAVLALLLFTAATSFLVGYRIGYFDGFDQLTTIAPDGTRMRLVPIDGPAQ